jgi:hypothetical protein
MPNQIPRPIQFVKVQRFEWRIRICCQHHPHPCAHALTDPDAKTCACFRFALNCRSAGPLHADLPIMRCLAFCSLATTRQHAVLLTYLVQDLSSQSPGSCHRIIKSANKHISSCKASKARLTNTGPRKHQSTEFNTYPLKRLAYT